MFGCSEQHRVVGHHERDASEMISSHGTCDLNHNKLEQVAEALERLHQVQIVTEQPNPATWKRRKLCLSTGLSAVTSQCCNDLDPGIISEGAWGSLAFSLPTEVSISGRKAPSQWVAQALTSETKTQIKSAQNLTE